MHKAFERPSDQNELEDREASGLWEAIVLSREIGESDRIIDLSVVKEIHHKILGKTMPEAAGRFRVAGEDIKKLSCIEPPPGSDVGSRMYVFEKDLSHRTSLIRPRPEKTKGKSYKRWLDSIFDLAAWVQHSIVAIHPFCDGNGRLARLMTNVILRRFNLPLSSVKIEAEDKPKYINALCRIDEQYDYRPLKNLIIKGSIATYEKEQLRRKRIKEAA